jgi:hypothetical protein
MVSQIAHGRGREIAWTAGVTALLCWDVLVFSGFGTAIPGAVAGS